MESLFISETLKNLSNMGENVIFSLSSDIKVGMRLLFKIIALVS